MILNWTGLKGIPINWESIHCLLHTYAVTHKHTLGEELLSRPLDVKHDKLEF